MAGELWSAICPQAKGNTNFPEVTVEDACGVGGGGATFVGGDDRPSGESVGDDKEALPCNREEVCQNRLEGPVRVVVVQEGFLRKAGLEHLACLTGPDSTGDVGINVRPRDSLTCPSLRSFHTPMTVVEAGEGAAAKGGRNNDPGSVEGEVTVGEKVVPQFLEGQEVRSCEDHSGEEERPRSRSPLGGCRI